MPTHCSPGANNNQRQSESHMVWTADRASNLRLLIADLPCEAEHRNTMNNL